MIYSPQFHISNQHSGSAGSGSFFDRRVLLLFIIEFLKEENLKELRKDELVSDPEKNGSNFLVFNHFEVVSCLAKMRNIEFEKKCFIMICPQYTRIITLMLERRVRLAGYGFLEIIPKAIHGQTVDEEVSHDVCMSERHSNSVVIKMKPPQLSGVHLDKVGGNEIDRNWQVRHDVDSCSEDHGNYSLPL